MDKFDLESTMSMIKQVQENLDIQSCSTFSPNISIVCIRHYQKKAIKQLDNEIKKTTAAAISETVRKEILSALQNSKNAITKTLIGDNEQDSHHRNANTNLEGTRHQDLLAAQTLIETSKTKLVTAIVDKAKTTRVEAALQAKLDKDKKDAEIKRLEDERLAAEKAELVQKEAAAKRLEEGQAEVRAKAEVEILKKLAREQELQKELQEDSEDYQVVRDGNNECEYPSLAGEHAYLHINAV